MNWKETRRRMDKNMAQISSSQSYRAIGRICVTPTSASQQETQLIDSKRTLCMYMSIHFRTAFHTFVNMLSKYFRKTYQQQKFTENQKLIDARQPELNWNHFVLYSRSNTCLSIFYQSTVVIRKYRSRHMNILLVLSW